MIHHNLPSTPKILSALPSSSTRHAQPEWLDLEAPVTVGGRRWMNSLGYLRGRWKRRTPS